MDLIVPDENGKPRFVGQEDPHNPPVSSPSRGSRMVCPVCQGEFDYLLGENTSDGGVQGCEKDYRPSRKGVTYEPNKDEGFI